MAGLGTLTRRSALGLIAGGALITIAETMGFSEVSVGRGVDVSTAADSSALLGIEGTDAATTPTFTNNGSTVSMNVELDSADDIEFDVNGDGNFETPPVDFDIGPGAIQEVELGGTDDVATVSIFADLTSATDGSAVGSIDLDREFDIPQSAAIKDVVGTIKSVGGSGKFNFALTNTQESGGQTANLTGISVDWTDNPDAYKVGGNEKSIFEVEDVQLLYDELLVGDGVADFQESENNQDEYVVELAPQEEKDFAFDRFLAIDDNNGKDKNADVNEVDITIRAQDGSTAKIELRED